MGFDAGMNGRYAWLRDTPDHGLAAHDGGPELIGDPVTRAPGQVLHAHASCWTDPPAIAADSVALLRQSVVAPWGEQRGSADDGVERGPADHDAGFAAFASAVRGSWLRGDRARVRSAGPVTSSRFA
ncbi:hypothetical protein ACH47Z_30525 [Streptomyces sp. NPDC020192]|uniref:hypothetical protein n=1 Tax=Streptomyces sp. NPDC020192 TaxID=3365066 RepID=UPI0037B66342